TTPRNQATTCTSPVHSEMAAGEVEATELVAKSYLRIFVPKSSGLRSCVPHDSQSTVNVELNGALHEGQRRSIVPPHCGQSSGTSASYSSNQRRAAPHSRQKATQSPSTFRRSSRSQSDALPTRRRLLAAHPISRQVRF